MAAALVVPVLPVLAAAPAFAADSVICVNTAGGTCTQSAATIPAAITAANANLVDDTILHHLECTTFPNWVGTTQVRPFEVDEDSLTLYPPKMLMNGKIRSAKVRLDRIKEQWS